MILQSDLMTKKHGYMYFTAHDVLVSFKRFLICRTTHILKKMKQTRSSCSVSNFHWFIFYLLDIQSLLGETIEHSISRSNEPNECKEIHSPGVEWCIQRVISVGGKLFVCIASVWAGAVWTGLPSWFTAARITAVARVRIWMLARPPIFGSFNW